MVRVLVTGSRDWRKPWHVEAVLDSITTRPLTIVHGGANGVDTVAATWAERTPGVQAEAHPVPAGRWQAVGRAAGPLRNQHMVDLGAALCVAFIRHGSAGATDCWRRASEAGILTMVLRDDD